METIERSKSNTVASAGAADSGIVVFSHLRWKFVWQRPQQFLSRFAKDRPVLFIEEPVFDLEEGAQPKIDTEEVAADVTIAVPRFSASAREEGIPAETMRTLAGKAIEAVNGEGAFDSPLLWYYSPMDASWSLGAFENSGIVYDCMDELSQFKGAPKELVENERRLIDRADIVFTGGYELWTKKSQQHENAHFFGCGVEYDHFAQAQDENGEIPEDIKNLKRPIIGWFGVVDERFDYDLVKRAAELRPDWSFVMVGPVVKVDPESLPKAGNLHWLGGRDYKDLPKYCRGYDVCMMSFAINEATEFINPTKALEYLATGKPVVGTPVKDVVRQYSDLVYIVKDADEFVRTIDEILRSPDQERIQRGIEKARECSWESTVSQMQDLIRQATARTEQLV